MPPKLCARARGTTRTLLALTLFFLASAIVTFALLNTASPVTAGLQSPVSPGPSGSPFLLPERAISPGTSPVPGQTATLAVTSAPAGGNPALIMWIVIGLVVGTGIVVGTLALQRRPEQDTDQDTDL